MRDTDGKRGPVAPRPDVSQIHADAEAVAAQARRRRAHSKAWERELRDSQILSLAGDGVSGLAIARQLGLRMRTVYRVIEAARG